MQKLLNGRSYTIGPVSSWDIPQQPGREARVDISFNQIYQIEYDWPWPPLPIREELHHATLWMQEMTIVVDLEEGIVLGIMPERHPYAINPENLPAEKLPPGYMPQPKPEIPKLTENEEVKAKEITLSDPRVQELIEGKDYEVAPEGRIGVWHASKDLQKIGATLEIVFKEPYWIEYDWPGKDYNEERYSFPYYRERTFHQALWVKSLMIDVDFGEGKVVSITPFEARTR